MPPIIRSGGIEILKDVDMKTHFSECNFRTNKMMKNCSLLYFFLKKYFYDKEILLYIVYVDYRSIIDACIYLQESKGDLCQAQEGKRLPSHAS